MNVQELKDALVYMYSCKQAIAVHDNGGNTTDETNAIWTAVSPSNPAALRPLAERCTRCHAAHNCSPMRCRCGATGATGHVPREPGRAHRACAPLQPHGSPSADSHSLSEQTSSSRPGAKRKSTAGHSGALHCLFRSRFPQAAFTNSHVPSVFGIINPAVTCAAQVEAEQKDLPLEDL